MDAPALVLLGNPLDLVAFASAHFSEHDMQRALGQSAIKVST